MRFQQRLAISVLLIKNGQKLSGRIAAWVSRFVLKCWVKIFIFPALEKNSFNNFFIPPPAPVILHFRLHCFKISIEMVWYSVVVNHGLKPAELKLPDYCYIGINENMSETKKLLSLDLSLVIGRKKCVNGM